MIWPFPTAIWPFPTAERAVAAMLAAAAGLVLLTACTSESDATPGHDGPASHGWEHVHNLAVDGDLVLLGTHAGLWQQQPGQDAVLVSSEPFDVMALTRDGSRWLASGHPGRGGDGPADLGLIESTDHGRTWRPVALSGEIDFHRLSAAGSTVIGLSAHDGSLLRSTDDGQTWSDLGTPSLVDIALDPTDGTRVLAITETGPVRSVDGGATFTPIAGAPLLALLAWSDDVAVGVDPDGQLYRSVDSGESWSPAGHVGGQPTALAASADTVAALTGGDLRVSTNGGHTFAGVVVE